MPRVGMKKSLRVSRAQPSSVRQAWKVRWPIASM
jgi:hypothetical protein